MFSRSVIGQAVKNMLETKSMFGRSVIGQAVKDMLETKSMFIRSVIGQAMKNMLEMTPLDHACVPTKIRRLLADRGSAVCGLDGALTACRC